MMDTLVKIVVSLAVVVLGLGGAWYLKTHAPEAKHAKIVPKIQSVAVRKVVPQDVTMPVYSRGEVSPSSEIQLVLEVAGQVTYVSSNMANGGFFKKGEVLLRVDDSRYQLDITKAEARVVSAKQKYRRMRSELSVDEDIEGLPSPQRYRQRQLDELKAQVEAAQADFRLVSMQLEKTILRAPFDGRIRRSLVGRGQYISPGMQLAQAYPVDSAEVRLPLSDRQLALVDIPNSPESEVAAPFVTFKLTYGEKVFYWQGKIVRTEGGLDARNRLLYAVAQIPKPYVADPMQPGRPPLSAGQFLEAEIQGRLHKNVIMLPRTALRNGSEIWVVERERLQRRDIEMLYKSRDAIFIKRGLRSGDHVVLTPMDIAVEGMQVRSTHMAEDVAMAKGRRIFPVGQSRRSRSQSSALALKGAG